MMRMSRKQRAHAKRRSRLKSGQTRSQYENMTVLRDTSFGVWSGHLGPNDQAQKLVIWGVGFDGGSHFHIWPKVRSKGQVLKLKILLEICLFVYWGLRARRLQWSCRYADFVQFHLRITSLRAEREARSEVLS